MRARIEEEQVEAWLNEGGAAPPEFAPHIAERQQTVRARNSFAVRARAFFRERSFALLFWALTFLLICALGLLYLIAENAGWFNL
jgi:hypothetical protein